MSGPGCRSRKGDACPTPSGRNSRLTRTTSAPSAPKSSRSRTRSTTLCRCGQTRGRRNTRMQRRNRSSKRFINLQILCGDCHGRKSFFESSDAAAISDVIGPRVVVPSNKPPWRLQRCRSRPGSTQLGARRANRRGHPIPDRPGRVAENTPNDDAARAKTAAPKSTAKRPAAHPILNVRNACQPPFAQ